MKCAWGMVGVFGIIGALVTGSKGTVVTTAAAGTPVEVVGVGAGVERIGVVTTGVCAGVVTGTVVCGAAASVGVGVAAGSGLLSFFLHAQIETKGINRDKMMNFRMVINPYTATIIKKSVGYLEANPCAKRLSKNHATLKHKQSRCTPAHKYDI